MIRVSRARSLVLKFHWLQKSRGLVWQNARKCIGRFPEANTVINCAEFSHVFRCHIKKVHKAETTVKYNVRRGIHAASFRAASWRGGSKTSYSHPSTLMRASPQLRQQTDLVDLDRLQQPASSTLCKLAKSAAINSLYLPLLLGYIDRRVSMRLA